MGNKRLSPFRDGSLSRNYLAKIQTGSPEQKNLVGTTGADSLYRRFYYFVRNPGYSWLSSNENGRAEFSWNVIDDTSRPSTRNQRRLYIISGHRSPMRFRSRLREPGRVIACRSLTPIFFSSILDFANINHTVS